MSAFDNSSSFPRRREPMFTNRQRLIYQGTGERWIPAFAGMTVVGLRAEVHS